MIICKKNFSVFMLLSVLGISFPMTLFGQSVTVFSNAKGQYRIPSIVECKSGKYIAFTDHRYQNQDIGGGRHLDIVMKVRIADGTGLVQRR